MEKIVSDFVKLTKKGTSKKEKKEKDPDAPKRPTNAYMIFSQEMRPKVKEEMQINDPKQITSKLAEMWRGEKEKNTKIYKKYTEKLMEKKTTYENEKAEYDLSHSHSDDESEKIKGGKKSTKGASAKGAKAKIEKPKKAPSLYNTFCSVNLKEMKTSHPDTPHKDLMGLVAAEWKKLTEEEKQEFAKANSGEAKANSGEAKANSEVNGKDTGGSKGKTADKVKVSKKEKKVEVVEEEVVEEEIEEKPSKGSKKEKKDKKEEVEVAEEAKPSKSPKKEKKEKKKDPKLTVDNVSTYVSDDDSDNDIPVPPKHLAKVVGKK